MKILLSTAALIAAALPIFQENPDATKVFATSDGNIFLPDSLNRARLHAKEMKLEVQTIDRATATASTDVLEQIATDTEANMLKDAADKAVAAAAHPAAPTEDINPVVPIDAARDAQEKGTADATMKIIADAPAPAAAKPVAKPAAAKPAAAKPAAAKPAAAKPAAAKPAADATTEAAGK